MLSKNEKTDAREFSEFQNPNITISYVKFLFAL